MNCKRYLRGGGLECLHCSPASQEATGREPCAWVYNWATLSLGGHKNRDLVLQVGGLGARLICCEIKRNENRLQSGRIF
jgi:hypothetical protein